MILAAGLGTRLGGITRELPKALVPIGGVPMIERVARSLIAAGADRLIINVHHFGERIIRYVEERNGFGVEVVFSHEREYPLETGGGLRGAMHLFRGDEPFFLHNADVLTSLDLSAMYLAHDPLEAVATLAVMRRRSSRALLFDAAGLVGRKDDGKGLRVQAREARGPVEELAFAGVHVISPRFLKMLDGYGEAFSILDPYLAAAAAGERIVPFRVDGEEWIDIGKPDQLAAAERTFGSAAVRPGP